ncbi:MAG: sulfite exporter TauE/SafE family protein [Bdellovibrionaceae bacterium]|nr:sulfite exporter TauE/SafE family protein [Pseudobdellovibrionaceae bacterium]
MYFHDIALVVIAFLSELVGTLSGFGSSTFFVPFALLIERFQFVLVLTAILHCFGNLSRILIFRKNFQWNSFAILIIPSVIFTGIGAILTTQFPTELMQKILGFTLIIISLILFFGRTIVKHLPKWLAIILSLASGFFTGFIGTGGALRGLALTALQLPKNTFVMTSASVDIGGDLLRASIYLKNGYMDWDQWFYLPLLGIAALIGARLGQAIINRLNQEQFEKIVSLFVFMSGFLMILKIK